MIRIEYKDGHTIECAENVESMMISLSDGNLTPVIYLGDPKVKQLPDSDIKLIKIEVIRDEANE